MKIENTHSICHLNWIAFDSHEQSEHISNSKFVQGGYVVICYKSIRLCDSNHDLFDFKKKLLVFL